MSAHNDGGPAFPQMDAYVNAAGEKPVYVAAGGMTLRDYFAAHASDADVRAELDFGESWDDSADRCRARFRHADAMLAARGAA